MRRVVLTDQGTSLVFRLFSHEPNQNKIWRIPHLDPGVNSLDLFRVPTYNFQNPLPVGHCTPLKLG